MVCGLPYRQAGLQDSPPESGRGPVWAESPAGLFVVCAKLERLILQAGFLYGLQTNRVRGVTLVGDG